MRNKKALLILVIFIIILFVVFIVTDKLANDKKMYPFREIDFTLPSGYEEDLEFADFNYSFDRLSFISSDDDDEEHTCSFDIVAVLKSKNSVGLKEYVERRTNRLSEYYKYSPIEEYEVGKTLFYKYRQVDGSDAEDYYIVESSNYFYVISFTDYESSYSARDDEKKLFSIDFCQNEKKEFLNSIKIK